MAYETIDLRIEDSVAEITLNRPDRLNAWTDQLGTELRKAILEDAAAVLRMFSAAPVEEQLTMLRFTTVDPDAEVAFVNRLVGGWKQRRR